MRLKALQKIKDNHSMKAQHLISKIDRQLPPQIQTLQCTIDPNVDHMRFESRFML